MCCSMYCNASHCYKQVESGIVSPPAIVSQYHTGLRRIDPVLAVMDNRRHRYLGAAIRRLNFHGDASAAGMLCQIPSATRVLLLTTAPHEVAPRLVGRFDIHHFAREQLSAAGQHIQPRRNLEALPDAQVSCLGSPQLAGLACQLGLALGPLGIDLGRLEPNRLATLVFHPAIEETDNANDISLSVQFLSVVMAGRDRHIDINRLLHGRRDAREVGWMPERNA